MQFSLAQKLSDLAWTLPSARRFFRSLKILTPSCLSLLAMVNKHFWSAGNVFARVGFRYCDVRKLVDAIEHSGMTPQSIARLYSLSGNDFNVSCNVASNKAMVRTYYALHTSIGSLETPASCRSLYYHTFVSVLCGGASSNLPPHLSTLRTMSPEWCSAVRSFIFFHSRTTTASVLLPQDGDLDLSFRRAVLFKTQSYWHRAAVTRDFMGLPVSEDVGYTVNGSMILETKQSAVDRNSEIKFRFGKRSCGKTTTNVCCDSPRCGCSHLKRFCSLICGCDLIRCANRVGSVDAARARMAKEATATSSATLSSNNAVSISFLLNAAQDSVAGTISEPFPLYEDQEDTSESSSSEVIDLT
eukprot:IDg12928t1